MVQAMLNRLMPALALVFAITTAIHDGASAATAGNGRSADERVERGVLNLPLTGQTAPATGAAQPQNQEGARAPRPAGPASGDAPRINLAPPQIFDYGANLQTEVFGASLFTGSFARQGASHFNPDYALAVGDQVHIRLWGAYEFDEVLTVDPKGNVFIPHAGPVQVLGVRNQQLQQLVDAAVSSAFRNNVRSYASLAAAQPVRVFVGGFVNRPGVYSGTSLDSLLHYLDQAGGIDPERGSFLVVQVKRGGKVRATANLYDFLLNGNMPQIQLADGDTIFVAPRRNTIKVSGLAANAKRFEFMEPQWVVRDLVAIARPHASATHVRIVRNTGAVKNVEYYPLAEAAGVLLQDGDELEFTADKKPGTITVRVEGEHSSPQEYVLPYGARLGDLLKRIQYSDRSEVESVQLFRESVKERQRQMLASSLHSLESVALTARSGTSDEARLRKEEADLILQWVERARGLEPSGQVVISRSQRHGDLLLENGDIIRVPARDGLVLVSGEVLFPNAVAHDPHLSLDDYVRRAGGYTQNADAVRVVVARRDGSFAEADGDKGGFILAREEVPVRPGDQILVLPKIDVKSRQVWKDLSQIMFQIALSAKVVLGL